MEQPIYLLLENGEWFEGKSFGAQPANSGISGEVVFTTAMTGYLETLTDPSYCGQIVVQTFPLIGNYGIIPEDFESSRPRLTAYVVKEWCRVPSNFRNEGDLDAFLKGKGIPGLYGIDTRALTRRLRDHGSMNGLLTLTPPPYSKETIQALRNTRPEPPVPLVTRREPERFGEGETHIVLWDFGAKQNLIRELVRRGCRVTAVPSFFTAEQILALHPQGVLLSNGPGDPADNTAVIQETARLFAAKIPMMGVCLGHQLMALSRGAQTEKLPFGHRGANQPVKDNETGRVSITSQNHGYTVRPDSLPDCASLRFLNCNDGTCEGIVYRDAPAFSVQFHPEACAGPHDTAYLFDDFLKLVHHSESEGFSCR
ncbi:carbamoyl phosphate synthase small subunit [Anaeromassilibacillus sp. An200]|uniref:carbamoyl phosphate synthase small subunit n=1 Tax=Anaeromassilibacillus sp. An200 TaxID=1965587 RepID=UPI000B378C8F|nr:carbamoyl phosphate synthase small subunit [Anaeromassilibacillus sp. An200]OUP07728.1 carbamoyl phosphate synthase small subunit [Anaeromassilibacillus sp. An200]